MSSSIIPVGVASDTTNPLSPGIQAIEFQSFAEPVVTTSTAPLTSDRILICEVPLVVIATRVPLSDNANMYWPVGSIGYDIISGPIPLKGSKERNTIPFPASRFRISTQLLPARRGHWSSSEFRN